MLVFKAAAVYDGPEGSVVFAQLVWRTDVVFVSARPRGDNPWANVGPASIALAAEDAETVDRHYRGAVAAGAEIIRPLHDAKTPAFPHGSHQFDVRDPEGNLWTIGTFQPRIPVRAGGGIITRCSGRGPRWQRSAALAADLGVGWHDSGGPD